jgi:hypothetical protein
MNVNGRKSDMAAQNFQNLRNLQNTQKTDKSGLVGNAQEATAADNRPEGETIVNNTVVIDNITGEIVDMEDDGSGVIVWLLDGHYHRMEKDQKLHDVIIENFEIGDNLLDDD